MDRGEQRCIIYRLQPGAGPEYDARHREVWPEVVEELTAGGIWDYSIFRRGDLVISVFREGTQAGDWDNVSDSVREPASKRWSDSLGHLFEAVADQQGNDLDATRVYRLDGAGVDL